MIRHHLVNISCFKLPGLSSSLVSHPRCLCTFVILWIGFLIMVHMAEKPVVKWRAGPVSVSVYFYPPSSGHWDLPVSGLCEIHSLSLIQVLVSRAVHAVLQSFLSGCRAGEPWALSMVISSAHTQESVLQRKLLPSHPLALLYAHLCIPLFLQVAKWASRFSCQALWYESLNSMTVLSSCI